MSDATATYDTSTPPTRPRRALKERETKERETPPDWVTASLPTSKFSPLWTDWGAYMLVKGWNQPWMPVPPSFMRYGPEIDKCIQRVRSIKNRNLSGIFVIASLKGGCGKSTTASQLAWDISVNLDVMVIIFDADTGNRATGRRLRVEPNSNYMTARQMADAILKHNWEPTADDIIRCVQFDPDSHAYVLPDFVDYDITPEQMTRVATTLKKACYALIIDTAPGAKEKATYGALEAASVPIVSAIFNAKDDMTALGGTVNYDLEAIEADQIKMKKKGSDKYRLRERIDNGEDVLAVFHAVPSQHLNLRTQYQLAERFGLKVDNVMLVPYNEWLHGSNPVNPKKVTSQVRWSQVSFMERAMEVALYWNESHPAEMPDYLQEILSSDHQVDESELELIDMNSASQEKSPTEGAPVERVAPDDGEVASRKQLPREADKPVDPVRASLAARFAQARGATADNPSALAEV